MCERCTDITREQVDARVKDALSVLVAGAIGLVVFSPVLALIWIKARVTGR